MKSFDELGGKRSWLGSCPNTVTVDSMKVILFLKLVKLKFPRFTVSPTLKTWHVHFQWYFSMLRAPGMSHIPSLNPAQSHPDPDLLQTGHKVCALGCFFVKNARGMFQKNQNNQFIPMVSVGCFCVRTAPPPPRWSKKNR